MRYNRENGTVELSVEELCAFAFRRGDLDGATSEIVRLRASQRRAITEALMERYGLAYHESVSLHNTAKVDGVYYCVEGVADGILCVDGQYCVDAFGVSGIGAFMNPSVARLYCFAYFLLRQKGLDSVRVRGVDMDKEGAVIF